MPTPPKPPATPVKVSKSLHKRIIDNANERGVSIRVLVDEIVTRYYNDKNN